MNFLPNKKFALPFLFFCFLPYNPHSLIEYIIDIPSITLILSELSIDLALQIIYKSKTIYNLHINYISQTSPACLGRFVSIY